ncbi:hypothetical protein T4B_8012 [Trichinella pseudospiralis]|uniref:Uncharacterized protein n=1 Tax=Trichinella pseudospiralis TaxID=6337 RepID=A0A0V1IGZ9_TRIPS|nr:hypothetical protein T4B_8012 [Trichinella pseudospiralis]
MPWFYQVRISCSDNDSRRCLLLTPLSNNNARQSTLRPSPLQYDLSSVTLKCKFFHTESSKLNPGLMID